MSGARIVFVDRDGTLCEEPPDEKVDSLDKIRLLPGVIPALLDLTRAGYTLVMVTNQDGLGTPALPADRFALAHGFLLALFASQGIEFDAVFICPHHAHERCGCRKPDLGMVRDRLKSGHPEKASEQVGKARRLVAEGLAEARQSIWELRSNDTRETLPKRLAHLVQRETFSAINPHLEVRGAYRPLSPQTEREILRLANEALVNVARHAQAGHANLTLYYSTEALMLTVEDNGSGFDVDAASREKGHFGLMGMRERASVVDGDLEIVSRQGVGTTVRLRVPLHPHQEERGSR